MAGRRVQARPGRRRLQRQALAAAPLRAGREGEDRALDHAGDADQRPVHHRDQQRAQAPRDQAHPGEARPSSPPTCSTASSRRSSRRSPTPASEHRPRRPRRRHDPDARRPGEGRGADRQGAAQGRQPGRGRRDRRRDPGRACCAGDVKDVLLLDVTPLTLGHRDQGRRDDEADRAQHDDPVEEVGDLLDRRRQPAVGRDPRAPGRARDGRLQQVAGQVPAHRDPAGAARAAADRGHVRHRRQRHPQRRGQGPRHRQGADDRDQGRLRPRRLRGRADDQGRRVARRGRPQASASWPRRATSPRTPPTQPRSSSPRWASRSTRRRRPRSSDAIKAGPRGARVRRRRRRSRRRTDALQAAFHKVSEQIYAAGRPAAGRRRATTPAAPTAPARPARPRTRSSTPRSSTTSAADVEAEQARPRPRRSADRLRRRRIRGGRRAGPQRPARRTPSASATSTSSSPSGRRPTSRTTASAPVARPPTPSGGASWRWPASWCPSVDNLERAMAAWPEPGIRRSRRGLRARPRRDRRQTLGRAGVESFDPLGERFDPAHSEAISTRPAARASSRAPWSRHSSAATAATAPCCARLA